MELKHLNAYTNIEIHAQSHRILRQNEWVYKESGKIRTRPHIEYELQAIFSLRTAPEWEWGHPIPYYYTWDHATDNEQAGEFRIEYVANKALKEIPDKITIAGMEWIKKGHVWREFSINGEAHTQEIWYKENWHAGTLYKDIWVEWDRGAAREEIHISEGDGMRFRSLYNHAKQIHGPPGFFWYKEAKMRLAKYPPAVLWRFVQSTATRWKVDNTKEGWAQIRAQDFGYNKWPTNEWVKIATAEKTLWTKEENIHEADGEVRIDGKVYARR